MINRYFHHFIYTFLIAMTIYSCSGKKESMIEEVIRPVKYGKISLSSDAQMETFSGSVQSSKETKLSFKVSGKMNNLSVKVGDIVRQGHLIANIDQTDYSIQYQQSVANQKSVETQIKSANTQLINSKATFLRLEKLYENNSVSLSEFEQAKSAYELAQSSYDAALAQSNASQKQVESAKNQVNYSTLTAPYTGVITSLLVEENELVNAGTPIVSISAMDNPEISVGVPEIYISKIDRDQPVEITVATLPDILFKGKVYEVGFSSLGGSTYPVTVRIDGATEDIRPGMAADVHFNFDPDRNSTNKQLVVPVSSVGEDTSGNFVFALEASDDHYLVKKVSVDVGKLTPSGFEVQCGLKNGDLVATAGLNIILEGMKVRLIDQKIN